MFDSDQPGQFFFIKMFQSNGNGDFNLIWTSPNNSLNFTPSNSLDLLSGHRSDWKFISGNFVGDNKDEIVIIQPTA